MKNLRRNEQAGITLIALIITIIVLLILAGVSISLVVGDNGVLTQSQQASTKTNKATEFETIQLSVAGSFNDEGNLDLATLVNNLRNEMPSGSTQVAATKDSNNNDIFPVIVSAKYGMYEIDENGKAENTSGVNLNETDLKIFAGSEVTLTATVSQDLVGRTVTWSTGSSTVASISAETGESITVTAGTSGSTTITAQVEGGDKVGTCTISVVQAVSSITLDNTTLEIEQGGTGTLTATVSPATNVEDIEFVIDANANEAGAYFGTEGTLTKTVPVGTDGKATVEVNVPEDSSYINKTTTIRAQGKNTRNVSEKVGTRTIKVKKTMSKAEKINTRIGDVVTSYSSPETSGYTGSWRIFYADDDELYLITTDTISINDAVGSNSGIPLQSNSTPSINYTGSYNVAKSLYGAKWNRKWLDKINQTIELDEEGNEPQSVKIDGRHKATAYLCDEKNWSKYLSNTAPLGSYVVGGPTCELFIKSLENKPNGNVVRNNYASVYGYIETSLKGWITVDILPLMENEINKGLYNNGLSYFLASSSYYGYGGFGNKMNYIDADNNGCTYEGKSYSDNNTGVRPVVVIPMSKVLINGNIISFNR